MTFARRDYTDALAVFFIAFALCACITKTHTDSWNDTSRIAAIDSLVERGTFQIDASPLRTGDKYRYRGHFYSDKEPLLVLMGAGAALALRPFHLSPAANFPIAYYLITLFTVGVCFAAGAAYAYLIQRLLGFTRRVAFTVAGLTALATPVLAYATVLVNHVPCGVCVLIGTTHALLAARGSRTHAVLSGLFFALAVAFDAAAIVFFLVPLPLLRSRPQSTWLAFAAGSVPVLVTQAAFNRVYSGSVVPPAMNGSLWNYPGSPFLNHYPSLGLLGSFPAYADYLLYLTIGEKGLFTYSPLVVVAAYGLYRMWRNEGEQRELAVGIVAGCALFLIATLLFTDDRGNVNYGERRYVDFFPLLCIGLGPALAALRRGIAVVAVRAVASLAIVVAALGAVWPWAGGPAALSNLDRFHALWLRAPLIATIDALVCLGLILTAACAIEPARIAHQTHGPSRSS